MGTCVKYFKRMAAVKLWLEMEIGITGGEEDGVDNTGVFTLNQNKFTMFTKHCLPSLPCSPLLQHSAMFTVCTSLAMLCCLLIFSRVTRRMRRNRLDQRTASLCTW